MGWLLERARQTPGALPSHTRQVYLEHYSGEYCAVKDENATRFSDRTLDAGQAIRQ